MISAIRPVAPIRPRFGALHLWTEEDLGDAPERLKVVDEFVKHVEETIVKPGNRDGDHFYGGVTKAPGGTQALVCIATVDDGDEALDQRLQAEESYLKTKFPGSAPSHRINVVHPGLRTAEQIKKEAVFVKTLLDKFAGVAG